MHLKGAHHTTHLGLLYHLICTLVGSFVLVNSAALANPSLTLSPAPIASNLDLDGEGSASTHIVKIADLEFSTTEPNGCTLTLTSGSINKVGGTNIDYQITTVADGNSAPTPNDFTVPSGHDYTLVVNDTSSVNVDVYILYTPEIFQDPGLYSSNMNVSITDNP